MTLRLNQLKPIAAEYASRLPGWRTLGKDTLVRLSFPFLQGVHLYRSSTDDYRPVCFIIVMIARLVSSDSLPLSHSQDLKGRRGAPMRPVRLRNHAAEFEGVLQLMIRQFEPPIDRPLAASECFAYCEAQAVPTIWEAVDLAALYAYHGNDPRAAYWIQRYHAVNARAPGDKTLGLEFIQNLTAHLAAGDARPWLDEFGRDNVRRLGLQDS
ncbi:MAG: hypothetical protein HZB38_10655 [Planctomycetes bacterium]|nr:hypothetical protein [Planctomycetota bacterium]